MRAFIAIELSDEIKESLARLQKRLKESAADIKWVDPHNVHLTLKFLGDIEDAKIEDIKTLLDNAASQFSAFEIKLSALGAFPNEKNPRVIWVGLSSGVAESEKIAASIESGAEKIGFPKEDRPFSAHLTLGRTRSGKNKDSLKEKLASTAVKPLACAVSGITLFQSTLTPKGPIYTSIHQAPLR